MTILLETVIARVESADLPYAQRFEEDLYLSPPAWVSGPVKRIVAANVCTQKTALNISATSYGLFQILGAVLYGDPGLDITPEVDKRLDAGEGQKDPPAGAKDGSK